MGDQLPNFFNNQLLAWRTHRAMGRAARAAVEEFRGAGVTRSWSFLGFHCDPVIWLVTETDAERDALCRDGVPRPQVIKQLLQAGVRKDLADAAGVTVESKETVDRDHGGNWRHAMQ